LAILCAAKGWCGPGDDVVVYRVKPNGTITHQGRDIFLSSTLGG